MRVGVNSGSLEKDLIDKYGFPCPEAMVESALRYIEMAERLGLQADDHQPEGQPRARPPSRATRSTPRSAIIPPTSASPRRAPASTARSRARPVSGRCCCAGSATRFAFPCLGDPVPEIAAGFDILRACDRRVTKPEVVACPTCGRLDIDLERIVAEVEDKMKDLKNPLRISILGCLVNGFGEAKEADLGIAAGAGKGIIFKRGVPIRHVKEAEMVQALLEEVERFDEETRPLDSYIEKEKQKQQKLRLPVLN